MRAGSSSVSGELELVCLRRLMKESMKWKEKIAENENELPPEMLFSQWAVQRELN